MSRSEIQNLADAALATLLQTVPSILTRRPFRHQLEPNHREPLPSLSYLSGKASLLHEALMQILQTATTDLFICLDFRFSAFNPLRHLSFLQSLYPLLCPTHCLSVRTFFPVSMPLRQYFLQYIPPIQ